MWIFVTINYSVELFSDKSIWLRTDEKNVVAAIANCVYGESIINLMKSRLRYGRNNWWVITAQGNISLLKSPLAFLQEILMAFGA